MIHGPDRQLVRAFEYVIAALLVWSGSGRGSSPDKRSQGDTPATTPAIDALIGRMYLTTSFSLFLVGGSMALVMRSELTYDFANVIM